MSAAERQRRYRQTPHGKAARQRANERWEAKNPDRVLEANRERERRYRATEQGRKHRAARDAVSNGLRSGALARGACIDCGSNQSEAHHHNGYDQEHWLDVEWLCRPHHQARHPRTTQGAATP